MMFSDTLESVMLLTDDACTCAQTHTDIQAQRYRHTQTYRHKDKQRDKRTDRHTGIKTVVTCAAV